VAAGVAVGRVELGTAGVATTFVYAELLYERLGLLLATEVVVLVVNLPVDVFTLLEDVWAG